jgi:hypothetical protein
VLRSLIDVKFGGPSATDDDVIITHVTFRLRWQNEHVDLPSAKRHQVFVRLRFCNIDEILHAAYVYLATPRRTRPAA